jgi:hypothetical protein
MQRPDWVRQGALVDPAGMKGERLTGLRHVDVDNVA